MSDSFIAKFVNSAIMSDGGEALPVNQLINSHIWHQNMNPTSVQYAARMIMRGAELGLTLDRMFQIDNAELRTLTDMAAITESPVALGTVLGNEGSAKIWAEADMDIIVPIIVASVGLSLTNFPTFTVLANDKEAMEAVVASPIAWSIAFSNLATQRIMFSHLTALEVIVGSPRLMEDIEVIDTIIASRTLFNLVRQSPIARNAFTSSATIRGRIQASPRRRSTGSLLVPAADILQSVATDAAYIIDVRRDGGAFFNILTVDRTFQGANTTPSNFVITLPAGASRTHIHRFSEQPHVRFRLVDAIGNLQHAPNFEFIPL